ncbi:hypothetical protein HPP92_005617 [Vanilla planifolia]|uniref:Uncharacterized protein n=1 Tax=Vanilla planifolia TaxID=51239 RepID=A0A835V984_VANPL|nr:hypothetical protein HPP92_005617 [Vanilla planifolia]
MSSAQPRRSAPVALSGSCSPIADRGFKVENSLKTGLGLKELEGEGGSRRAEGRPAESLFRLSVLAWGSEGFNGKRSRG